MKAKKQNALFTFLPFYLFTFKNIMPNDKKAYAQTVLIENSSHRSRLE